MRNVETKIEKGKLVITVDLTKDFGLSKTGKTKIVASSGGFSGVGEDGQKFNLTVIGPKG